MDDSQFDRDMQAMTKAYRAAHGAELAIDAFATAVARNWGRPQKHRASSRPGNDSAWERATALSNAYIRRVQAQAAEQERRNGAKARAGWAAYQAAHERRAAELGQAVQPVRAPFAIASALGNDPRQLGTGRGGPLRIW